jgi:hypothetical protein
MHMRLARSYARRVKVEHPEKLKRDGLDIATEEVVVKVDRSMAWWLEKARQEGHSEVGAGFESVWDEPRCKRCGQYLSNHERHGSPGCPGVFE